MPSSSSSDTHLSVKSLCITDMASSSARATVNVSPWTCQPNPRAPLFPLSSDLLDLRMTSLVGYPTLFFSSMKFFLMRLYSELSLRGRAPGRCNKKRNSS